MTMKLRSTVKSPQVPLMAISHRNSSIIVKQKAAGKQVRIEKSHSGDKILSLIPGIKKNKISTVDKHSKKNSIQSGKRNQINHSAAKKTVEVKRAGRGKKIQYKNIQLASGNALLADLDSIINPTVIENGRNKVVKAVGNIKQKPAALNKGKPASKTSLKFPRYVSGSNFSLFGDDDFYETGSPLTKKGRSVASLFVGRRSMKNPDLYSNAISADSTSDFTATVSRKQFFEETKTQVKSSNTMKTSFASFRFEKTDKKVVNNSKLPEQFQSVSQIVNYAAPTNYISSRKSLRPANTSESDKISANSFQNLKKSVVVKGSIAENKAPQPGTISARNLTGDMLQNKQVGSKPDKRKARQKSLVKINIVGATRLTGGKPTHLLAKKQKDSPGVLRNGRSMRSSRQKPPKSSKNASSVSEKGKNRIDDEKKTIPVKVSEISVNDHERSQDRVTKTRQVNKPSSPLTLKSLQTGKKKQFASLTKTTAKESGVRKEGRLTSRDYLPQNKSLDLAQLYAPLLAVGLTPIQSLVQASPESVTSSPTVISSVYKATKQATLPQPKVKTDLNQRRSLSLPQLAAGDVFRESHSSKFTSTPIQARPSLYRTEKASALSKRKSVTVQRQKESAVKHAKKNIRKQPVTTRVKKYPNDKTVPSLSITNKETVTQRKNMDETSAAYLKTQVSVVSASSPNKSAKKNNAKKKNSSLLSSVVNEASKHSHFAVGGNLHEAVSKIRKLPLPVSPKTVTTKSSKLRTRLQNNPVNMPPGRKLRSSHHLKKDVKLASTYKLKSYVVKRTEKEYQPSQNKTPTSVPKLHRPSNRPLESPKNITSLAAEVISSQKSHKRQRKSTLNEKQSKPLQEKRNSKVPSRLSSLTKRKNASLSNTSIGAKYSNTKNSATSFAEPGSQVAKVTNISVLPGSRKGVQRVSASQRKTSRLSEGGKIIKPIPYARNVRGSSHRITEGNLELINKAFLSQAKHSKKSLSSVLNRSPTDFSRKERSLILLQKRGLFPSKDFGEKPAPKRTRKSQPLPAVSVKNANSDRKTVSTYSVDKNHAAKYRVSDIHSNKVAKLEVKLKARKQFSPKKQISRKARTARDTKFTLSSPEHKKTLKTGSRQKVTEVPSLVLHKLPNLPKESMASKLTQRKTLSPKKSRKLSTTVDTKQCIAVISPSLVKAADVQVNANTPRQTETSKSKTLTNKVIQTSSLSQKKISAPSEKKVTKVVRSKIVVSEKIPKLSSKGGVKKSTGKRPGKVTKAKMMNWLTLGQNNTLQLLPRQTTQEARYFATSEIVPVAKISLSNKHSQLPKIIKGIKPASVSQKTTRSAKTTKSKKIGLVSSGKKKSPKPSAVGYQVQKLKSSTSPKKTGTKTLSRIVDNRKNSKLSKQTKATKVVISSAMGKNKEIEKKTVLISRRQKKAPDATSQGSLKIPKSKSPILAQKRDMKVLNKNKISGKTLSDKVSFDKVKSRKSTLSLLKVNVDSETVADDNINFVLQGQNKESASPNGYRKQKTKSSEQKKTERKKIHTKVLGKRLSKSPQLLLTRISATSSPDISRITKVKQITKKSSEQAETPKPVPARHNKGTTNKSSLSKKEGTKKKEEIISETYRELSNRVSPKISTRVNRRKSVSVSPKITRIRRSKNIRTIVLATSRNKALKLSPKENKTHKTKVAAVPKKAKKTVKQISSKIHSGKVNSKANIDASKSSPTIRRDNKRRTNLRNSLVSQGQKGKSKQLTGRQKNKEPIPTGVPKSHTSRVKPAEGISNVSFQKTEQVYTINKSFNKSQPSRSISTVRPFNFITEHASNETTPSAQHKRTRDTSSVTSDIIYTRQAQNISSSTRETAQASPELHHIYHGLGRRSLFSSDITDSNYSPQTNKQTLAERKVTVPLDTDIAESGYRRKEKMSPFPEIIRTELYTYNVNYARNDSENRFPVKRATKLQQASPKNVTYSEQNKRVSRSKVSFSSSVGSADDHTKYITSTPFPLRGKSAVSSMYIDSARDTGSNMETVSISQPLLSYKHHVTTGSRSSNQRTSHVVSENDSDEESVANSSTKEGNGVEAEEANVSVNRKAEENELQESRDNSGLYAEAIEKDYSKSLSLNSHSQQCIIS